MLGEGIDVALTCLRHDLVELQRLVEADTRKAEATRRELDALAQSVERLAAELPESEPRSVTDHDDRPAPPVVLERSWDEVRAAAATSLAMRGIDLDEVSLDELLDPEEVARIRRRMMGGFELRCHLDSTDLLIAAAAGVAATVVDALIVRVPRNLPSQELAGSWLTGWLREHAIESDNWLAGLAKVPFDAMTVDGHKLDGMSGRTHRAQTFGHDPLIGLVVGTLDIMRGTITGVGPSKGVFVADAGSAPVSNPLEALFREVAHLASDLPTRAGLPVPGWALLSSIPGGSIEGVPVNDWARRAYGRGYDTWHFLTMATVPATIHLVVRSYWQYRRSNDQDYAERTESSAGPTGPINSGNPHFDSLLLAAHSVAAAGNITKLIAYRGNPLALNYNEWLAFFRSAFKRLNNPNVGLTERAATQAFRNAGAIAEGWIDLAAAVDHDLPLPYDS